LDTRLDEPKSRCGGYREQKKILLGIEPQPSSPEHVAMSWKGSRKRRSRHNLRNYPEIFLEERRITKKPNNLRSGR
jgi:hypothetical protein